MKTSLKTALLATAALAVTSSAVFAQAPARSYKPVTTDMLLKPTAEEWLSWRGTLDNQGYSPLNQINKTVLKTNLRQLMSMHTPNKMKGLDF